MRQAEPDDRVLALVASFARIGRETMAGLPFYNNALEVEPIGFQPLGAELVGVLITPWFMNLMLVPPAPVPFAPAEIGRKRSVALPAGAQKLAAGGTEDFGMFHALPLVSPMERYHTQDQARLAARAALQRMLTPPPAEMDSAEAPSRRRLLVFGGRATPVA